MSAICDDEGRGLFFFREGGSLAGVARYQPPLDRYPEDGGQERMVVADGIVGERLVLAIGGEGFAHWELERFADRRSGLFGNIMPIECVTEGGRCHARLMRERLGRITAILDELFEVDLAVVVDLSPHAALELVAVEQSDLLRGDAIQSQVPQRGFNNRRERPIAYDGFLFEVELGVGVEVLLDEFAEHQAATLGDLSGLALFLEENGLPLYLFLDLLGCHSRFGSVGHGSAYLLAVNVVPAGYHEHITAVSFDDGRHYCSPAMRLSSAS